MYDDQSGIESNRLPDRVFQWRLPVASVLVKAPIEILKFRPNWISVGI
jgi:hypothetical protein